MLSYNDTAMTDELGHDGRTNSVIHTTQYRRRVYNPSDETEIAYEDWDTGRKKWHKYRYIGPGYHWYAWGDYGWVYHSNVTTRYPKTDQELIRQAVEKFYGENEVDTLLNIVESPELLSGLGSVFNTSASVPGRISGGYLYYSFGIAPLISDLQKIHDSLGTLRTKLEEYLKLVGKPYTARAVMVGSFGLFQGMGEGYRPPGGNNPYNEWWSCEHNIMSTPTKVVCVRGVRANKYYSEALTKLDYMLKRFGSKGPASFVWERIPFSFVIDWFVDLRAVFGILDNALTGGTKEISDISLSEKWRTHITVKKIQHPGWESPADGQQTAYNELGYYRRDPVVLSQWVGLRDGFGKRQSATSVALLLQQLEAKLRS